MAAERDLNDLQAFVVAGSSGDYVFRKGDEGADLFLLQQGQVELIDESGGAAERFALLSAGDVFGERQVFEPGPRPMSARGVTEFQAFRIDRATLAKMTAEDAGVAVGLIQRLAMRPMAWPAAAATGETPPASAAPGVSDVPNAPAGDPHLTLPGDRATFRLAGDADLIVGRPDRASGFVPDIDLSPHDDERSLSRRHARIRVTDAGVFVREEPNARNGTFVDGRRVQAGVDVELTPGMSVRFGLVDTVFEHRERA